MPSKASGKTDSSTHPSHRVAGSNPSMTGAWNKSLPDAPQIPEDPGHSAFSSCSYDTASPLHFHGLADTQTQTQVASSAEAAGQGGTVAESRAVKKRKLSYDSKVHLGPKAPLTAANEWSEKRPASRSGSKLKRRRSSSVNSVDSFAEAGEWEDPAKAFLASNRQFEIPLSELGRRATEGEFQEGSHSMAKASLRPTPREPTQVDLSLIEGLPTSGPGATEVQQHGVKNDGVLSQSSDVSPDAQGRRRSPVSDIPDDASTPPVMSNPGSMDYLDSRVEDYEATQPLSDGIASQQRQASPWSSEASRPSRNARNILSMVNPEKKWRLQRGEQLLQAALQNDSDGQTQPSANFPGSSHVPSSGRKLFDQLAAQMLAGQQSSPRHDPEGHGDQDTPPLNEDSRDTAIVPDSEPPKSANTSSTSARPHLLTPPKGSSHDGLVDSSLSQPVQVPSIAVENEVSRRSNKREDPIDDDDEEDIPLLLTVRRPKAGAAPPSMKVNNPPKSRMLKPTGRSVETKASSMRGIPRVNEIPSSVPEQDHLSSPSQKLTSPRREGKECEDSEEDALVPGGRSDQVTPAPDESSTEPADDLPMDTEDDVPALSDVKASSSRRRPPASRRKAAYKLTPRATSHTPSMASGTRSTKQMKNHHRMATRVFALWKQDAAYFSGIVCERVGQSDRFKIHFDDGDEDLVDVKNLRRLELQIGDRVSIIDSHEKATIANVDGQHPDNVTVRLTDDPSAELEVKVTGLKVQSRAIRSQWDNRTMNADEIVTLVPRTKAETPTSLRNSSASLSKRVLSKVGIVVTLSVGRDWEREKDMITRIIRTNGGTVLDDWSDIFFLTGGYSFNKKRWVITSDNIGTEMKDDIQQVFLVSDAANAKPRFLTALALGIPCLSVEWLRALSSGQCAVSDWPSYLLPAGYSDTLGARVTQMVDLDWGTTLDHLTGIVSNNVATKLFSKKSVLVLGPEYFPPPAKGKKGTSGVSDEKSSEGGRFIPRIIVSMGAARVEAVPELKYSSSPDLKDFHYVVVKDLHERPSVGGEKYVSMEWVKDCLIAGRMFPPRV